jgi:hypothetical protein
MDLVTRRHAGHFLDYSAATTATKGVIGHCTLD